MKNNKIIDFLSVFSLVGAVLIYLISVVMAGGSLFFLIRFNICLVFIIFAGAYFLEKIIKGREKSFYIIAGMPLAVALSFISFLAFKTAIPVALFGLFYLRKLKLDFKRAIHTNILMLSFSAFLVLYSFIGVLPFAKAEMGVAFSYHQDMLWSVGNVASVFNGFPFEDMRLAGTSLNYHYLNDVFAGIIAVSTGTFAYDALCFYYYPILMAMLMYGTYYISNRISNNKIISSCMPLFFFLITSSVSEMQFNYIANINGQGTSSLVLASCLILFEFIYNQKVDYKNIILVFIYSLVLTMFKSTIGALFSLALLSASLVYIFINKAGVNKLIYSISALTAFLLCNILIFSKAVNNLVFIGFERLITVTDLFKTAPVIAVLFIVFAFYYLFNLKKLSFIELVLFAVASGGVIAYTLYKHYSFSEIYFLLSGIYFMIIINAKIIASINKKSILYTVITACVISSIFTIDKLAIFSSNGIRVVGNITGILNDPYDESYITNIEQEGMEWLRDNSEQSAIFATNRNNKYLQNGDGIFHYSTAVSQRRCYLESYRYTMDYSGMYTEVVRRLEDVSDNIFFNLNEDDAFSIAKKEGINYLVVYTRVSDVSWEKEPVFDNGEVKIYMVL